MRKKSAAALRSAIWILIGMPALNLVVRFIYEAFGHNPPTFFSLPNYIVFMVAMGGFSAWYIANAKEE